MGTVFRRFEIASFLKSSCMIGAIMLPFSLPPSLRAGTCEPCDADCDAVIDSADVSAFIDLLLEFDAPCSPCAGDTDTDGMPTGLDVPSFVECLLSVSALGACCESGDCLPSVEANCQGVWLGAGTTCSPDSCIFADLTAHRPQHGNGYFPFAKTAVEEVNEVDDALGPGIRINAPGDTDPAGEDDLIEALVTVMPPGAAVALRRSDASLAVWTTRTKTAGTEIPFDGDKTAALPIAPTETELILWIEWQSPAHGFANLHVEPTTVDAALDTVRFHTFRGIVMALGGEGQAPSVPVAPESGTFVVGTSLYQTGYDVHMYDEDNVAANGSGIVYDEAVNAIQNRQVDEVAIFGYSHGGGSTYDLADRLDVNRAGIGVFEIVFTSYVDSVENDSDFDTAMELRRPPSTAYHANHYQNGVFVEDLSLDGGPVSDSNPPPTGLDVETTDWGKDATHFLVDDYFQVRDFIEMSLVLSAMP